MGRSPRQSLPPSLVKRDSRSRALRRREKSNSRSRRPPLPTSRKSCARQVYLFRTTRRLQIELYITHHSNSLVLRPGNIRDEPLATGQRSKGLSPACGVPRCSISVVSECAVSGRPRICRAGSPLSATLVVITAIIHLSGCALRSICRGHDFDQVQTQVDPGRNTSRGVNVAGVQPADIV